MDNIAAIVMAGGKGTRMNSDQPKVLHEIGGVPMIFHTLKNLREVGVKDIFTVVSHQSEQVIKAISPQFKVEFAHQLEPLGTADAVNSALFKMEHNYDNILVVGGDDSAFYSPSTLLELINSHLDSGSTVTMMTLVDQEKKQLGKVFRDENGNFDKVMEKSEYEKLNLSSDEINCGVYVFEADWLKENIDKVEKNPQKGEYYLTDLINMAKEQAMKVNIFKLQNKNEWFGVNTPKELAEANRRFEDR